MAEEMKGFCVFIKVDVDKAPEIAERYSISAMPTFKILVDGVEKDSLEGASESRLRELIQKHKK